MLLILYLLDFIIYVLARDENVLLTEVFEITIDPSMFNWTYEDRIEQYVYRPSLINQPDLPSWISYIFSKNHHAGFLYGVPPKNEDPVVPLEIVALNRKNYETRVEKLNIHISEKLNPAKYEVHMTINNLNVEDMFNIQRMENLKNIFRNHLWKDSQNDIYVTFLASAIQLGARKPLNPDEGEGVVIRLGSTAPFSTELIDLQDEVKPLWKMAPCPRKNYKKTSVERFFREPHFSLDWCSFRLIDNNKSAMHQSGKKEKLSNTIDHSDDRWEHISRNELPQRFYGHELMFSIILPVVLLVIFALVLSLILCFHHEGIADPCSEDFFDNIFHICEDYYRSKKMEETSKADISQYVTIQKATQSLRSLSSNRDISASPDPMLLPRSHTNSPTSTINRGIHCRPSPPPYVRPKFKADF